MKRLAVSVFCAAALFSIPSDCFAQLNIQGEDGSTVQIGPGGINVHSNTGKHSNVYVGPGGIKVNPTPGARYKSTTTTTIRSGATKPTSAVRTTTTSTTTTTFNLLSALAKLEMSAYGKTSDSAPIIQRIQKLEMDNLGHTGTGSNIARVQSLASAMGVNIGSTGGGTSVSKTTQTIVNTTNAKPCPDFFDVSANNMTGTYFCNSSTVSISANHCKLKLTGHCKELSISGNHNEVRAERISDIDTSGNHNTVIWEKMPQPSISNEGNDNNIDRAQ